MAATSIPYLGAPPGGLSYEELVEDYGPEAAGIVDPLIALQEESPVPWFVPDAIGLPPLSRGDVTAKDLEEVFEEISDGYVKPRPWFATGSGLNDQSGCNGPAPFYVDPKNRRKSLSEFQNTVEAMREGNTDMGVLLMSMVGERRVLSTSIAGELIVFGAEIVSFSAETVHSDRQTQMRIAFVQGLGIGAAEAGKDAVQVTVDRKSGKITSFDHADEQIVADSGEGAVQVTEPIEYRQKHQYFFDPKTRRIESRLLDTKYFYSCKTDQLIDDGVLRYAMNDERNSDKLLGRTPFGDPAMLSNLISVLQYVHGRRGPSRIGGAFLHRRAPYPYLYLYQSISPPPLVELARDAAPLTP